MSQTMNTPVHTQEIILGKIFRYLEEHLPQRPAAPLTGSLRLVADLGLDSLQSFEMVADLEDHFGVTVPMEALQHIITLTDVAGVLVRVLEDPAQ